jgi:hypothetical protein
MTCLNIFNYVTHIVSMLISLKWLMFLCSNCLNSCQSSLSFQGWLRSIALPKGHTSQGIIFCRTSLLAQHEYSHSDWAGCPDFGCSITRRSKKQSTIACSSYEAEYRALASATCILQCLFYIVIITRVLFALQLTPTSTNGQNILRLIVICHAAWEKFSVCLMKNCYQFLHQIK